MSTIFKKIKKTSFFKINILLVFVISLLMFLPSPSFSAAPMADYCIIPPFILGAGVLPNLLLTVDNSGSMFDLTYIDEGNYIGSCSVSGDACGPDTPCSDEETCDFSSFTRNPAYCYDQTYDDANTYVGYFKNGKCSSHTTTYCTEASDCPEGETCSNDLLYSYSYTDSRFEVFTGAFPASCTKLVPNILCIDFDDPDIPTTVNQFIAKGNYLNWLTASKFDVEKEILTGGKYASSNLIAESRGCVGRRFIKEANDHNDTYNTWDFVNYVSPEINNTNESLGVTFAVKGPVNPYNATSLSPGGQTYLDIFKGDYDQAACQEAIDLLLDPDAQKQDIITAIDECLENAGTNQRQCQFDTRDPKPNCNPEGESPDCLITSGTCNFGASGLCEVDTAGICAITTEGTCTANNGVCGNNKKCFGGTNDGDACTRPSDCPGGNCEKYCVGGGLADAQCNNNNDCKIKSCAIGKVGIPCDVNDDCDLYSCTAGEIGELCDVNQDCDIKKCTTPASRVGDLCDENSDCADNQCSADSPVNPGGFCTNNWDCSKTYGLCLPPATSQIKSTFTQSMHSCYQLIIKDQDVGSAEVQQVSNPAGCSLIYSNYKLCIGGENNGKICTGDADCGAGLCKSGPDYIIPGSPVLLCSSAYAGYCASTTDNWMTTNWNPKEYGTADDCIMAKYREFCGDIDIPPVVDPTDDPSDTSAFQNLPAIIADLGIEAQLGDPVETFNVKVKETSTPTGLIQQYSDRIRFGAMSFNYNGSSSECAVPTEALPNPPLPCPKVCSSNVNIACLVASDCPSTPEVPNPTCDSTVNDVSNFDGASIIHYIGYGVCSISGTTCCQDDPDCAACPDGETCNLIGNHSAGLINTIDQVFANSWTPFSEAFYNAIGYFARTDNHTKPPTFGTSRADIQLNPGDFDIERNPSQYKCQANNLLFITDGMSTADLNADIYDLITTTDNYNDGDGYMDSVSGACPEYSGSRNLDDLSWLAWNRHITNFTETKSGKTEEIYKLIKTFAVYSGATSSDTGECNPETLLKETADNGGGLFAKANDPKALKKALGDIFETISQKAASGTAASVLASGEDEGANMVQAVFYPTRKFEAGASSYEIDWTGVLQNLWYYIDPDLTASSIREDTPISGSQNMILTLAKDKIAEFTFNVETQKTMVNLYADDDGDGIKDDPDNPDSSIEFEYMNSLWETGKILWQRKVSASGPGVGAVRPREIKTSLDGSTLMDFSTTNAGVLAPYLETTNHCSTTTTTLCDVDSDCPGGETCVLEPANIIKYINGEDITGYRSRTVSIDLDNDNTFEPGNNEGAYVWKLGDIVNSTPKIVSWTPLDKYDTRYNDDTYKSFINDPDNYQKRGLVFVGANDGMLHVFKQGLMQIYDTQTQKKKPSLPTWDRQDGELARLVNTDTGNPCSSSDSVPCGEEIWAYIPKHILPYLRFNADPNYGHLYYVDGAPYVFDASIGEGANATRTSSSWRTILIGRMGLGGSSRSDNAACAECVRARGVDLNGDGDTSDTVNGTKESLFGTSTYFAIDITAPDPDNWKLMWEFSDEDIPDLDPDDPAKGGLGFTTTGPLITRISGLKDGKAEKSLNGEWFVIIPSGPTGPIESKQFMGRSEQNLRLFVLDLRDGSLKRIIDKFGGASVEDAFGGSLFQSSFDSESDPDYQDNAFYLTYTNSLTGSGDTWTTGGVIRVLTLDESTDEYQETSDTSKWKASILIEDTGATIGSVDYLKNNTKGTVWLFFGTGRYFYKKGIDLDDSTTQRRLFGIKDPCYVKGVYTPKGCNSSVDFDDLNDVTTINPADPPKEDAEGWYINLDGPTSNCLTNDGLTGGACTQDADCRAGETCNIYDAERVVTNPVSNTQGSVYFVSFKPSADVCSFGGKSHLWGVQYNTGDEIEKPIKGKAIIQVSTGAIKEINLKDAFKASADNPESRDDRRTASFIGKGPDGQGLLILSPPPPYSKAMHFRER